MCIKKAAGGKGVTVEWEKVCTKHLELWVCPYLMSISFSGGGVLEVHGWSSCQNSWADSKRHFFQFSLSANFPFLFFQTVTAVSEREVGASSCRMWARQTSMHWLHLLPTLPGRLCCSTAGSSAAFSATTTSAATSSAATLLALQPPPQSKPLTFGCTDGWISWVSWYAMQRCFFFSYGGPYSCKWKGKE